MTMSTSPSGLTALPAFPIRAAVPSQQRAALAKPYYIGAGNSSSASSATVTVRNRTNRSDAIVIAADISGGSVKRMRDGRLVRLPYPEI